MRALILQFEPDDGPGLLGRHFEERGVACDAALMYEPHAPLSLDAYDVLVALGGVMGVRDSAEYPFLEEAEELYRVAIARKLSCLGICLGGQLLAHALGAPVTRNPEQEVGLVEIALQPEAHSDPLLRGLPPVLETVHFHEDTFGVPPGGVRLASSARCVNQIVRCAERAYAFQFHPEASWQVFGEWIEQGYRSFVGPERAAGGPLLAADVRAHDATIRAHAAALFDSFLRLAAPAPAHAAR